MPESAFLTPQRLRSTGWRNVLISSDLHHSSLSHRLIPDPSHSFLQTHPFLSLAVVWDGRGGPGHAGQGKQTGCPPHPSLQWEAPATGAGEDPASLSLPASNTGSPIIARHPAPWGLAYQDEGHPVSTSCCHQEQRQSSPKEGPLCCVGTPGSCSTLGAVAPQLGQGMRNCWRSCAVGSPWGKTDQQ